MANKNMPSEKLLEAMRESFKRSKKYLNLETYTENQRAIQKETVQMTIQSTTPEQIRVVDALGRLKTSKNSWP